MPNVRLRLPQMLQPVAGKEQLALTAATFAEALEQAFDQVPVLRHHLTDGDRMRGHVLCLHNGVSVDRTALDAVLLADGDELTFHQAISGG